MGSNPPVSLLLSFNKFQIVSLGRHPPGGRVSGTHRGLSPVQVGATRPLITLSRGPQLSSYDPQVSPPPSSEDLVGLSPSSAHDLMSFLSPLPSLSPSTSHYPLLTSIFALVEPRRLLLTTDSSVQPYSPQRASILPLMTSDLSPHLKVLDLLCPQCRTSYTSRTFPEFHFLQRPSSFLLPNLLL